MGNISRHNGDVLQQRKAMRRRQHYATKKGKDEVIDIARHEKHRNVMWDMEGIDDPAAGVGVGAVDKLQRQKPFFGGRILHGR